MFNSGWMSPLSYWPLKQDFDYYGKAHNLDTFMESLIGRYSFGFSAFDRAFDYSHMGVYIVSRKGVIVLLTS